MQVADTNVKNSSGLGVLLSQYPILIALAIPVFCGTVFRDPINFLAPVIFSFGLMLLMRNFRSALFEPRFLYWLSTFFIFLVVSQLVRKLGNTDLNYSAIMRDSVGVVFVMLYFLVGKYVGSRQILAKRAFWVCVFSLILNLLIAPFFEVEPEIFSRFWNIYFIPIILLLIGFQYSRFLFFAIFVGLAMVAESAQSALAFFGAALFLLTFSSDSHFVLHFRPSRWIWIIFLLVLVVAAVVPAAIVEGLSDTNSGLRVSFWREYLVRFIAWPFGGYFGDGLIDDYFNPGLTIDSVNHIGTGFAADLGAHSAVFNSLARFGFFTFILIYMISQRLDAALARVGSAQKRISWILIFFFLVLSLTVNNAIFSPVFSIGTGFGAGVLFGTKSLKPQGAKRLEA